MQKHVLSAQEIQALVADNKYKPAVTTRYQSRCVDGRYEADPMLPALAIAGADVGELAILAAAANEYGFEIDLKKAFDVLTNLVGGVKNIRGHTDSHTDPSVLLGGCGHVKHKTTDWDAYGLTLENTKEIISLFAGAKKKGAQEVVLRGEHKEGAVLLLEGEWSVYPKYVMEMGSGRVEVGVFVFHKTLVDARHRELAKKLVEEKAVQLYGDLDEEYLYEVISDITDDHLMETAKRLAKGLPIFNVKFAKDGTFELEEVGVV